MTLRILMIGDSRDLEEGDVWRWPYGDGDRRWWEQATLMPEPEHTIEIARLVNRPSALKEWFNG